jgi:hypothetical protein
MGTSWTGSEIRETDGCNQDLLSPVFSHIATVDGILDATSIELMKSEYETERVTPSLPTEEEERVGRGAWF